LKITHIFLAIGLLSVLSACALDLSQPNPGTRSADQRLLGDFWRNAHMSHAVVNAFTDSNKSLLVEKDGSVKVISGRADEAAIKENP
jgi:hypothetical protein